MRENVIYTTTNYDDFVFRVANRDVDMKHVDRIAESMASVGWQGAPIEVSETENGKFQIEDGQHRYLACKKTNTPIRFMVVKAKTIFDVAVQNSMKKGWTGVDYIKAYSADGNYNYKRLKTLEDQFPKVTLTDILEVIGDGKHKRENLKKGYIRITDEQFYMAREVLKSFEVMSECLKSIGIKTVTNYKRVLIQLLKHNVIDADRMIDKLDKHGKMLLPLSATRDQAMQYLEVLYNYHQPKGTTVLLREKLKNNS